MMFQEKAYSKLLELADQIATYDRFLSVSEETAVEKIEDEYGKATYWIVAALSSGRAELHERLSKIDRDLDAIAARQAYSEGAIARVRKDLREGVTERVRMTPGQRFTRFHLRTLVAVLIMAFVLFLWFTKRFPI